MQAVRLHYKTETDRGPPLLERALLSFRRINPRRHVNRFSSIALHEPIRAPRRI
jgi:hypothetical protein